MGGRLISGPGQAIVTGFSAVVIRAPGMGALREGWESRIYLETPHVVSYGANEWFASPDSTALWGNSTAVRCQRPEFEKLVTSFPTEMRNGLPRRTALHRGVILRPSVSHKQSESHPNGAVYD